MASILDGLDLDDPCAVYPKLEEALLKLIAGEAIARVRWGEDEASFTQADKGELRKEIALRKSQCAAKQTGRPARRALQAGFRR